MRHIRQKFALEPIRVLQRLLVPPSFRRIANGSRQNRPSSVSIGLKLIFDRELGAVLAQPWSCRSSPMAGTRLRKEAIAMPGCLSR